MSFTQAAGELGVSQPAVSLAIRQLEQAIGQTLFHREHRAIRLTEAGEGIALGWRHVVDSLISTRLLVPVVPQSWITGEEFHLIWSDHTRLSDSAQRVRDWIIEEARIVSMVRLP
jgi:DNA-binding transcriptional LysR family regulator